MITRDDFTLVNGITTVTYNGQTMNTKNYCHVTDEQREEIKKLYLKKPVLSEVNNQFITTRNGKNTIDKIVRYYFLPTMTKTLIRHCKWTIEDMLNSNDVMGIFMAKIKLNDNVFRPKHPIIQQLRRAIQLGGYGIAKLPTQFPLKIVRDILEKYNINNNYYDYSCGWGIRLLGALSNQVNYFGTDPNTELVVCLNEMLSDYRKVFSDDTNTVDIRAIGSQEMQKDWVGRIGLAFSSPPYFDLEDYRIGKQSYKEGVNYQNWLNDYLFPTINNIHEYLISDGYFIINIKNAPKYPMEDDVKKYSLSHGFELVEIIPLKLSKRTTPSKLIDGTEKIYVFKKI